MSVSSFFDYPTQDEATDTDDLVFLGEWSQRDWGKLLGHTETYRYEAGEYLIRQGHVDRSLFLIAEGQFEVLIPEGNHRQPRRIAIIESGSVIGEQAFLDNRPRSADVRATIPSEIFRLSFEAFEIFAAREPDMARSVLLNLGRILSARLRQMTRFVSS